MAANIKETKFLTTPLRTAAEQAGTDRASPLLRSAKPE